MTKRAGLFSKRDWASSSGMRAQGKEKATSDGVGRNVLAARISWPNNFLCLVIAIAVIALVTARFSPRFVFWRGLTIAGELPRSAPEFDRAVVSLAQMADPWASVDSPVHKVIGWRKLFPFLGHYLHMPRDVYLALPHLGCLLATWLGARLTFQRVRHVWPTFVMTTLFTALPWFFVSTSWLTYFDSWMILGLLVAAFVPSRAAVVAACLLTPWVDERFLLCLPATMAVRAVAFGSIERSEWKQFGRDVLIVLAASAPYVALRAASWLAGDPNSASYVRGHWAELPSIPAERFLWGFWSGYRCGWLVILAGVAIVWRRAGPRFALALAVLEFGTAIGGLFIAWDMSRSMMMIAPMFLLSMWLCADADSDNPRGNKAQPESAPMAMNNDIEMRERFLLPLASQWFLPAILAANLIAPAHHVLWSIAWPVEPLPVEIENWRNPPSMLRAHDLLQEGRTRREQTDLHGALALFNAALECEPDYPLVLIERSILRVQLGDLAGGRADLDEVLRLLPKYELAFYLRGILWAEEGDHARAADDLRAALQLAPADWPSRTDAERRLRQLTSTEPSEMPAAAPPDE